MSDAPLVRVVVLNYEGGDMTLDCLRSLRSTDWPSDRLEIVLVDNASHDGVADIVERELPGVRVVRSATNRGFAGGCNLGFADLGAVEHVALLNNDATVEQGWLAPLVAALEADDEIGAASPKILLAGKHREVEIDAPTARRGRRELGVRVDGARVDGDDVWRRVQLVEGFWGREADGSGQWTKASARLRLPEGSEASLLLSAERPSTVTVTSGARTTIAVDRTPAWYTIPFTAEAIDVVNNAGSALDADLHGVDRGYLEPDDGHLDTPQDVFAWCGAAVVLRRQYLDEVGHFDERLFLYYEDLELAWRGRERGWRHRYVPESVVRHVHAATSVEGSRIKHYFDDRNRLIVLRRHARRHATRRAVLRYLAVTASYAGRDIFGPLLRLRRPRARIVAERLRAFAGFVRYIGRRDPLAGTVERS